MDCYENYCFGIALSYFKLDALPLITPCINTNATSFLCPHSTPRGSWARSRNLEQPMKSQNSIYWSKSYSVYNQSNVIRFIRQQKTPVYTASALHKSKDLRRTLWLWLGLGATYFHCFVLCMLTIPFLLHMCSVFCSAGLNSVNCVSLN